MASAAAIKTTESHIPAASAPLARHALAEVGSETLGDRNFVIGGEVHARALQAQLDRAFSADQGLHGPEKLAPRQSAAVILGASAALWVAIGYGLYLYLI